MAVQPVYAEDRAIHRALRIIETRFKRHSVVLDSVVIAGDFLRLLLAGKEREEFWALWLDSRHALIESERLAYGTVNVTAVYPREVVKSALRHNAVAVIFGHNHPSGDPEPSLADECLTDTLRDALALVNIQLVDHFVVTPHEARSATTVRRADARHSRVRTKIPKRAKEAGSVLSPRSHTGSQRGNNHE